MEETTDDQNSHQNNETYEESYNSLNAELATVSQLAIAVESITDTEPQQEQQERQNMNTINVTIQEQYNSTTQTTNHEETMGETTKPDANLKQILDFMKILSDKVDKIENQNLNQHNNNGNPMNTPATPTTSQQLPIETITIKEETISDNEIDPPSQTCDGNDRKRKGIQCPLCNKAVQNELMLKAHLKTEHKLQANPTKPQTNPQTNPPIDRHSPKIKCQICHITIKSQHMLEEHMSTDHGCKIIPKRTHNTNLLTNDYNPPQPCQNMDPDLSEFFRNHPWEPRVTAANRRIYKTSENEFYKQVIGWIIEEIEHDLKQNPSWRIRVCTRNKNTKNADKKLIPCQWYQTKRCRDIFKAPCHAERNDSKVHYTHACEICYRTRNALIEHSADQCELLELLDLAEIGEFPDTDILYKIPEHERE